VFPGSGIQDNLADKARKLGISVWRFRSGGAWATRHFGPAPTAGVDVKRTYQIEASGLQ
jgi:hypothetical protein